MGLGPCGALCKHCTKCKSRHYCSKKCQLVDWKEGGHKEQCKQLATEFSDRLLDELMPLKKVKEEPPIVDDVAPAAGLKAAARLSAARTAKASEAGAVKDDTPDWRGTCAICLDLLPIDGDRRTLYSCCCKRIYTGCYDKCVSTTSAARSCREPRPSDDEALRLLQKHSDKVNADAQEQLGYAYRDGNMGLKKSLKRAFKWYELAATKGIATGQVQLAHCYLHGEGVKINSKTAALWYRRAAEQGYPPAQGSLGVMFANGEGVAQSYEEAMTWFRLAAAQGDANALYNLGTCYDNGNGVPEDYDEALRFYKRAAANGHVEAAAAVSEVEAELAAAAADEVAAALAGARAP